MNEEIRYKILKILEQNSDISQRELSKQLGISLGKVNYCLRALKEKGLVKARNFKNSDNKKGYLYVLTPKGVDDRARTATRFLKQKISEYQQLEQEIEHLRAEIKK